MLSFLFGALAGFSEIISRYRDEPLRAIRSLYGASYLIINGLVSIAAFGFLLRYPKQILPSVAGDPLMTAIAAGFGAVVVLRSKLFTFRTEDGKEYPFGPSIVTDTFLGMLDRKIDRARASQRQKLVFDKMKGITGFDGVADYLEASLLSFQHLSQEEKSDIAKVLQQYRSQTAWPDQLRIMAVGFAFLTIAGDENFDQVIANLRSYLSTLQPQAAVQSPAPPSPSGPAAP